MNRLSAMTPCCRRFTRSGLTSARGTAIKTGERALRIAISRQCPGASPGRRNPRITSPRLPSLTGRDAMSPEPRKWSPGGLSHLAFMPARHRLASSESRR
jgi:hypothetical protein